MQGHCTPPSHTDVAVLNQTLGAAGLLPLQEHQCLIFSSGDAIYVHVERCDLRMAVFSINFPCSKETRRIFMPAIPSSCIGDPGAVLVFQLKVKLGLKPGLCCFLRVTPVLISEFLRGLAPTGLRTR